MPPRTLTRSGTTPIPPDSKQMNMQFVLDCNIEDPNRNSRRPLKQPIMRYPAYGNGAALYPTYTKPPRTAQITHNIKHHENPIEQNAEKSHKKQKGEKPKIKYVDPPIVEKVSTVLEKVYNYFEDALTDKVIVKQPRSTKSHKKSKRKKQKHQHQGHGNGHGNGHNQMHQHGHNQMHEHGHNHEHGMDHGYRGDQKFKRSTIGYQYVLATSAPYGLYTQSYHKVPKITTQVQVTADLDGQRPTSVKPGSLDSGSDSESDEYDLPEDEFDESEVCCMKSNCFVNSCCGLVTSGVPD